jgi:hypothetical protein
LDIDGRQLARVGGGPVSVRPIVPSLARKSGREGVLAASVSLL